MTSSRPWLASPFEAFPYVPKNADGSHDLLYRSLAYVEAEPNADGSWSGHNKYTGDSVTIERRTDGWYER